MTDRLRIIAEDIEDLKIISASLQDAIGRVGEMIFDSRGRAMTLRLSRFAHETDKSERVLSGLRIDSVLDIKTRGIERDDPEALAVLLSIDFIADAAEPSGILTLLFAGGGAIRLNVECIDVTLADVSDPRRTDKTPLHPTVSQ